MKFMNNKRGFTLVELLAVIVILALIMGIAAYSMQGVTENVKISSMKSSALTIIDGARNSLLSSMSLKAGHYYVGEALLDKDTETPWGGDGYSFVGVTGNEMVKSTGSDTAPNCGSSGSFISITEDATTKKLTYSICLYDKDAKHFIYASEKVLSGSDPVKSDYYMETTGTVKIDAAKGTITK